MNKGGGRGRALALLLLFAAPASAAGAASARVECRRVGAEYEVEGTFEAPVSTGTAWAVLTDYDGISGFVPDMRSSRVRERRADAVLVAQAATGKLFFFSRDVELLLEVREDPPRRLAFRDTLLRDFRVYEGSWTVAPRPDAVVVEYRLRVRPAFAVPGPAARTAFRRNARGLLERVRGEMLRRGGPGAAQPL